MWLKPDLGARLPIKRKSFPIILSDALRDYSQDFSLLSAGNPVEFRLNGVIYSAHLSLVHDSGEGRNDDDEQRIQVSRSMIDRQAEARAIGKVPVFLGLFPDGDVFTAWTPEHVLAQQATASGTVYARQSHLEIVRRDGATLRVSRSRNLGRDVATISLPVAALGVYLENWEAVHRARDPAEMRALYVAISPLIEATKGAETSVDLELPTGRERITVQRTAFRRDPAFTRAVMAAYSSTCCVCGRQLLLVQAAHLIPHSEPDSPNDVTNGVALCVEHHRMYDDGLIILRPARRLELNKGRVEHLENIGQGAGIDDLNRLVARGYRDPEDVNALPNHAYLERGRAVRLGIPPP